MHARHLFLLIGIFAPLLSPATPISISTVLVGNASNADDSTSLGGVAYNYRIGQFEVTNAHYAAFLNSVAATDSFSLYHTSMNSSSHGGITRTGSSGSFTYSVKTGFDQKPVNYVNFWDAARFANWLTNGQPTGSQGSGTTETGVYNLGSVTNPSNASVTRDATAFASGGWALPSHDEWYKAAYYQPTLDGGDADNYWLYPTGSNTAPTSAAPNSSDPNSSNYGTVFTVTDVGGYTLASSHYGTFDQGGNVEEWTENIFSTSNRIFLGGSYSLTSDAQKAVNWSFLSPTTHDPTIGFRLVQVAPIPEPAHLASLLGALVFLTFRCTRSLRRIRK